MIKFPKLNILLPTAEEIINTIKLAQTNPDELTDREIWILREFGGDLQ